MVPSIAVSTSGNAAVGENVGAVCSMLVLMLAELWARIARRRIPAIIVLIEF